MSVCPESGRKDIKIHRSAFALSNLGCNGEKHNLLPEGLGGDLVKDQPCQGFHLVGPTTNGPCENQKVRSGLFAGSRRTSNPLIVLPPQKHHTHTHILFATNLVQAQSKPKVTQVRGDKSNEGQWS